MAAAQANGTKWVVLRCTRSWPPPARDAIVSRWARAARRGRRQAIRTRRRARCGPRRARCRIVRMRNGCRPRCRTAVHHDVVAPFGEAAGQGVGVRLQTRRRTVRRRTCGPGRRWRCAAGATRRHDRATRIQPGQVARNGARFERHLARWRRHRRAGRRRRAARRAPTRPAVAGRRRHQLTADAAAHDAGVVVGDRRDEPRKDRVDPRVHPPDVHLDQTAVRRATGRRRPDPHPRVGGDELDEAIVGVAEQVEVLVGQGVQQGVDRARPVVPGADAVELDGGDHVGDGGAAAPPPRADGSVVRPASQACSRCLASGVVGAILPVRLVVVGDRRWFVDEHGAVVVGPRRQVPVLAAVLVALDVEAADVVVQRPVAGHHAGDDRPVVAPAGVQQVAGRRVAVGQPRRIAAPGRASAATGQARRCNLPALHPSRSTWWRSPTTRRVGHRRRPRRQAARWCSAPGACRDRGRRARSASVAATPGARAARRSHTAILLAQHAHRERPGRPGWRRRFAASRRRRPRPPTAARRRPPRARRTSARSDSGCSKYGMTTATAVSAGASRTRSATRSQRLPGTHHLGPSPTARHATRSCTSASEWCRLGRPRRPASRVCGTGRRDHVVAGSASADRRGVGERLGRAVEQLQVAAPAARQPRRCARWRRRAGADRHRSRTSTTPTRPAACSARRARRSSRHVRAGSRASGPAPVISSSIPSAAGDPLQRDRPDRRGRDCTRRRRRHRPRPTPAASITVGWPLPGIDEAEHAESSVRPRDRGRRPCRGPATGPPRPAPARGQRHATGRPRRTRRRRPRRPSRRGGGRPRTRPLTRSSASPSGTSCRPMITGTVEPAARAAAQASAAAAGVGPNRWSVTWRWTTPVAGGSTNGSSGRARRITGDPAARASRIAVSNHAVVRRSDDHVAAVAVDGPVTSPPARRHRRRSAPSRAGRGRSATRPSATSPHRSWKRRALATSSADPGRGRRRAGRCHWW